MTTVSCLLAYKESVKNLWYTIPIAMLVPITKTMSTVAIPLPTVFVKFFAKRNVKWLLLLLTTSGIPIV